MAVGVVGPRWCRNGRAFLLRRTQARQSAFLPNNFAIASYHRHYPFPSFRKHLQSSDWLQASTLHSLPTTPKAPSRRHTRDIIKDQKQTSKWLQEDQSPTDPQLQQLHRSQLLPTPRLPAISSSTGNSAARTEPYTTPWRRSEPKLLLSSKLRQLDRLNSSVELSLLSKRTFSCARP